MCETFFIKYKSLIPQHFVRIKFILNPYKHVYDTGTFAAGKYTQLYVRVPFLKYT